MNPPAQFTSLRPLIPGVYLPSLLFSVGIGAMTPMIAVSAVGLGADAAGAALLVALVPVGQIIADLPAGALAARLGDRTAMIASSMVAMLALAGCALAPNLAALALAVLLTGATNSVYGLARQAHLTEVIAPMRRARAMSALGGVARIGLFIGPFAGAALVHGGGPAASYWLGVATSLISALVVWFVVPAEGKQRAGGGAPGGADGLAAAAGPVRPRTTMLAVLRDYRAIFTTLGIAVLLVGAVRGARQTVLPLWTEQLGYEPATTSLVFGLAGGVDMLLFYPAGKVMDRLGRLWVAVPSMLVMAVAMVLLPLTEALPAVITVALVLGIGNGMGSGILMTLGADTAPDHARAQYLGIWRLLGDTGNAGGPLGVSLGAALGSLGGGIIAMGGVGVLAAGALARWVPRWTDHANARTRRRAGLTGH